MNLYGLGWMVNALNSAGVLDLIPVIVAEGDGLICGEWLIGGASTAEAGKTLFQLEAAGPDGNRVWTSGEYHLRITEKLDGEPAADVEEALTPLQELIAYVNTQLPEVLRAGETAKEAYQHPPKIGESGTWWTWDWQTGAYKDTGMPSQGSGEGGAVVGGVSSVNGKTGAVELTAEDVGAQPKGNYLTEHQKIKTINGQSLIGAGNIEIEGGSGGTAQAVNYDLNVKAVNHRGYSVGSPENTIPAYIMSKRKGYTYVECDVSFTSDGVAVLLHDATIDRTSDGTGNISSMTYAQVLQYDFGSWFSEDYAGVKIPTFEEFLICCKRLGLHPYIELKSNGSYTQAQITQIVDEVDACGMTGKVTYISFSNTFLGYVKNADSAARLGLLANPLNGTKISQAVALQTSTNEVFMDAKLSTVTSSLLASCTSKGLPLEVWTVNTEAEILGMPAYVSGVTSDNLIAGKVLYEAALTYIPPESNYVPATGVTLDKTSLVFGDLNPQTITATVEPSNASDEVVWKSSDTTVAEVDGGVVTPLKKGSCTITATVGSVSATCAVTVEFEIITYTINRTLTNCTSSSTTAAVVEGTAHTETITAALGYTLDGAEIAVTMGGVDISDKFADGVLTIDAVTGDVVITVSAVRPYEPIVDLALANVTDGILRNVGTGGSAYDATVTYGDYTSDADGITLINHAYANTPYGFKASDKFTIVTRGKQELNTNQYQRLWRTDTDAPCAFYSYTSGSGMGVKMAGKSGNGMTLYDDRATATGASGSALNTVYIPPDKIDVSQLHTYVVTSDGSTMYYYLDGVLIASQNASALAASTKIGLGDNDTSKSYYAAKSTLTVFKIFDYAMTADEVAGL